MELSLDMEFSLDTVRAWLLDHGVAVFAFFAFIDAFGPTGLFIPASLVVAAAGFLCAEGLAPTVPSLAAMCFAAFCGNLLTFGLGRWFGGRLLARFERHVPRVRRMLQREGTLLLLFYHYVNTLRAAVPLLCGSLRYPPGRYLAFNTPGLFGWICGLFATGYLGFHVVAKDAPLWQRIPSALSVVGLIALGWYIWRGLKRAGAEQPAENGD